MWGGNIERQIQAGKASIGHVITVVRGVILLGTVISNIGPPVGLCIWFKFPQWISCCFVCLDVLFLINTFLSGVYFFVSFFYLFLVLFPIEPCCPLLVRTWALQEKVLQCLSQKTGR